MHHNQPSSDRTDGRKASGLETGAQSKYSADPTKPRIDYSDPEKWEQIIREALPQLLKMAIRLVTDLQTAEDCVQQALLKATTKRVQFDNRCSISTWLHQIVINQCRDQIRKTKNRREQPYPETVEFSGKESSPEQETSGREQQQVVRDLIEKLPQRQQEVLILSAWDNRPASEIAELLEIDITAVYSNLSIAKKKLKEWLKVD